MRLSPWLLLPAVVLVVPAAQAQGRWSGGIHVGYATGLDQSDFSHGSYALSGDLLYRTGPTLRFGAQAGYALHEDRTDVVLDNVTLRYRRSAWHVAGTLRLQRPDGVSRPYAAVALGLYRLGQDGEDFFAPGANIGAGLELHPGGRRFGIALGATLHLAGRPRDDVLAGAGFLVLGVGLVYR